VVYVSLIEFYPYWLKVCTGDKLLGVCNVFFCVYLCHSFTHAILSWSSMDAFVQLYIAVIIQLG